MLKHAQVLLDHLNSLYQRHLLTDVVLLVEDQRYQVHAAVLVAYSKHFQGILEQRPQPQTNEILLDNTTAPCVETLLQFLYSGKLTLDPSNVVGVYMLHSLAKQLEIEGLEQACQEILKTKDSSNISPGQDTTGHIKLEHLSGSEEEEACEKTNSENLLEDLEAKASQEDSFEAKPKLDDFSHIYGSDFVTGSENDEVSDDAPAAVDDDDDDSDDDWQPHSQKVEPDWEEDKEEEVSITTRRLSSTRRTPRIRTALESCGSSSPKKSTRKRKQTEPDGGSAKRGRRPKSSITGDYKCNYCNKRFESSQQLSGHIGSHKKKQNFHCRHCQGNFGSRRELELHLLKHGLTQDEVELERTYPAKVELRHSEINHSGQILWVCLECSAEYPKVHELANHMKVTHPAVTLTCFKCPYSTQLQYYLDRHVRKHREGEKPIECDICSKTFSRMIRLRRHKHKKHGVIDPALKVLQCPDEDCAFTGWTQFMLKNHIRNVHTPKDPDERHFCDICGISFGLKLSLQGHMVRKHTSVSKFICDQCGHGAHTAHELKRHQDKHKPTKDFQCQHCPYATYTQINLKAHMFRKHRAELDVDAEAQPAVGHQCDKCAYQAVYASELRKHMRSHVETRDVPCELCGKKYSTAQRLSQHMKVVHKPKNLRCLSCSYATSLREKLLAHISQRHRSYKPYQCPYCPYTCALSGNCRKHVMNKHKGCLVTYLKLGQTVPEDVKKIVSELPMSMESGGHLQ